MHVISCNGQRSRRNKNKGPAVAQKARFLRTVISPKATHATGGIVSIATPVPNITRPLIGFAAT